jgi:localization factor PodJL
MTSGDPWHLRGVRPEVLDSAREAARRSGKSVEEWLDTAISESAKNAGIDLPGQRPSAVAERVSPRGPFADITARLDALSRQVDHLAHVSTSRPSAHSSGNRADSDRITDVLARLDRDVSRLGALGGSPVPSPSIAGPGADVDQALAEIEARQRALDGGPTAPMDLPRAPTQSLPDLEQQLRQINARIDTMRPCNLDGAVETLRDDLAEIGMMLKEAMPRKAIEALEAEIRSLASRLDSERDAGADGAAMAGVERGLVEVRDALRALKPAESLIGFEQTVHGLAQKIDRIAGSGNDPEALKQLEDAITALRGVVSHVASNDTLTQLSEEVRALAAKVDQVTTSSAFSTMEQRIAQIADALQQSRATAGDPAGLETMMRSLTDKVDRLQATRTEQPSVGNLEERIMRLVEKLDASDSRFEHLAAIERGLADLLIQMESQRMAAPRAGIESAEAESIRRDVRRTQDSLETVHGTLGHVVDRLATIEAGIRNDDPRAATGLDGRAPAAVASAAAPSSQAALPFPDLVPSQPEPTPAARANPSPSAERRPIDPDLPPDHPLEPGAGRTRASTPAERIAASEAALENVRPPVIPDPAGKSNFIAAARRAAQAATNEAPAREKRGAAPVAGEAGKSPGKPPAGKSPADTSSGSTLSGHIRKLVVGASVLAIVLGAVHLVTTQFWPGPQPASEPSATRATHQETPTAEPPHVSAPPASDRQSTALPPGMLISPEPIGAGFGTPATTPIPANAEREATGSILPQALATAAPSNGPVPFPQPSPARSTPEDGLPPAFGNRLRVAAANGDAAAEFEVATRFADGRGVPQNLSEAAAWFERAASKGLAPAQFRLGGLYEKGLGVSRNLETARRLYVAAAEAGHAKAMHNLAVLYAEGVEGRPNYPTAARWFRKAADHGVIDSQYNLAILYARGIGVEGNLVEAFKWFALASREGDRDAAKKRDDIAGRLDKQTLATAMAAAQSWQAQPQPEAAIQVREPAAGWDAAPTPAAAKRMVGPKTNNTKTNNTKTSNTKTDNTKGR